MQTIQTRADLQAWSDAERAAGRRVALVPTMGALHAGHVSLMERARAAADRVVVSIFVNPTQFDDPGDFAGYPRTLEGDLEACRAAGVDVAWTPPVEELYPDVQERGTSAREGGGERGDAVATWVEVEGLTDVLCGASRPGHFRGVTTVVTKLFLAARPHVAVFGEKDFQQLAVVRRMNRDLGFGIEILGGATVRERDGLALSSRNRRLGPRARHQARVVPESLDLAERLVSEGERRRDVLVEAVTKKLGQATQGSIDYAELRDPERLGLAPARLEGPTLLAVALRLAPDPDGRGAPVRLIDNRVLRLDATPTPDRASARSTVRTPVRKGDAR